MAKAKESASTRAKRKWKKGLDTKALKERDAKKGEFYKSPSDRVSYVKRGVIKMYVPRDGKNRLRLVQPFEIEELGFYGMEMNFHRGLGDEGEPLAGDYLCNARMKPILKMCYPDLEMSGKCFVCNQRTEDLWESNPDMAKTFFPDRRIWFLVHDLLADDPNEVLLWSCAWTLHEEIVSRSSDEETTVYIDVSDPVRGVPISFEKSGKGKLTKYTNVQIFKKAQPLEDEVLDSMIEFLEAIVVPEHDTVKAAFLNLTVEEAALVEDIDAAANWDEDGEPDDIPDADEEIAEEEGEPDCFQKDYDKYQDCEDCEYATDCAEPPPPPKPEKPKRAVRKTRKPAKETTVEASTDDKKDAIRKKIRILLLLNTVKDESHGTRTSTAQRIHTQADHGKVGASPTTGL